MTIDLTNRCNMMCDPCFMDANQVGFVHELSWDEIKRSSTTRSTSPRRQMSIQFSGGEPTLSPHFLDAIRYAGTSVTSRCSARPTACASRWSPALRSRREEAGLRMAYLQFDGTTNESNAAHRKDRQPVRRQAARHRELHRAGIDVILVVTHGERRKQRSGRQDRNFAIENSDKITVGRSSR